MKFLRRVVAIVGVLASLGIANLWNVRRLVARALRDHPAPGQMVDVGGRRLHLLCRGIGEPTVVFEASGFGNYGIYGRAFDATVAITRACAYDRAGMGYSDPSLEPFDAQHLEADLERLLKAADVRPPYVLAGMSSGGPVVRLFTSAHPDEVRGLVLVDSLPEDFVHAMPKSRAQAERILRVAPLLARLGLLRWIDPFRLARLSPERRDLSLALNYRAAPWESARNLVAHIEESVEQVRRAPPLSPDLPLVVITHGIPGDVLGPATDLDEARAQEPIWQAVQEKLAKSSRRGEYIRVEDAGHIVTETHPEVVAAAIERLVHAH